MAKKKEVDRLDELAADPSKVVAMLLWQARFRNEDLSTTITERELDAYEQSCAYLKVAPEVKIVRPSGRPAQEAIPASPGKRAIPARPADPPRGFVFVGVVERGTENTIKPIENNEADADRRDAANSVRRYKEKAPVLAQILLNAAASGTFSTAELQEAANALVTLARAA